MEERCNVTCNCDMKKFSPICSAEGMTYFSSCRAGCTSSNIDNGKTQFFGCECISQSKKWLPSLYVYIQCVPTYNYFFLQIYQMVPLKQLVVTVTVIVEIFCCLCHCFRFLCLSIRHLKWEVCC